MGKHAVYFLCESCCVMETSQNKLIVMVIHVVPKQKITDTKYTFIENNYTNCKQGHCHLPYKEGVSKADWSFKGKYWAISCQDRWRCSKETPITVRGTNICSQISFAILSTVCHTIIS